MGRKNRKAARAPEGGVRTVAVQDAYSNPLFRLGYGSQSPLEAAEYPLTRMTGNYALLDSLYRDNWVVQNVVGIIPDDMTRRWFRPVGSLTPEQLARLDEAQRKTGLRDKICEGLRWGRLYGGAAGLMLIRGHERLLDTPLKPDTVLPGAFAGIYILDRWCGISPEPGLVADPADPDFGLPEYYIISGREGMTSARVHHSRILRFTGRELPYMERLAEQYWGGSEVEALYREVVMYDSTTANMAALTFRANVDTMEVQNLDQLFSLSSGEAQRRFWNTMQAQSVMRSNFGIQLVNRGDQIKNTQYSFTGLPEVHESMCLSLSGASRIPMTKLFGRSPAGLNATGESDLRNYYDYVDTLREGKLAPVLRRLLPVLAMSALGEAPRGLDVSFPPMWTPTAREVAQIARDKAETVIAVFQAGLMRADTAQKELKKLAGETELFDSITDEEIAANRGKTYQDVTALRDPLMGLGYGREEVSAADSVSLAEDFNPHHDPSNGRFTGGGSTGEGASGPGEGEGLTNSGGNGNIQSSPEVSATGENRFEKGFSKNNLNKHFGSGGGSDHSPQYPGWTQEQYAQRAIELVQSSTSDTILGYKTPKGEIVRYDTATNDFVKGYPSGGIKTMFKPADGKRYFQRKKQKENGIDKDEGGEK